MDSKSPVSAPVEIVLRNDKQVSEDFVVRLLGDVLAMERPRALHLISKIREAGEVAVGWYPAPVAESMISEAGRASAAAGVPLLLSSRSGSVDSCSFCGRMEKDVSLLKKARKAAICEECLSQTVEDGHSETGRRSFTYVHELLRMHFLGTPRDHIVTTFREFPTHLRVDLHLALDQLVTAKAVRFVGIGGDQYFEPITYASILESRRGDRPIVPVQYEEVDTGDAEPVRCPSNGAWLVTAGKLHAAMIVAKNQDFRGGSSIRVEIATPRGEQGERFVAAQFKALAAAIAEAKSYRGKVLSLETPERHSGKTAGVTVHRLAPVPRSQLILPTATLRLLERNVLDFAASRPALKKLGLSTRKGLLLYGPPGTGKTHTIRYLAGALADHTTLLITAEQAGLIEEYFRLARLLQPALMVIEDADLIARSRNEMGSACEEVLLNKLLNEMDGLKEDAEIFFILTSNRPEQLESALAGRPGRIDQAIEIPLPDASGRRKLVNLYGRGLTLDKALYKDIVARTEGVSAAFIKELMRRLAQLAHERGEGASATPKDVDETLQDMLFRGGRLNANLLGVAAGACGV